VRLRRPWCARPDHPRGRRPGQGLPHLGSWPGYQRLRLGR
jgi:hypothetical protein